MLLFSKNDDGGDVFYPCLSHKVKMAAKLRAEYSSILHMPVLKEGRDKDHMLDPYSMGYSDPGECSLTLFIVLKKSKMASSLCTVPAHITQNTTVSVKPCLCVGPN